VDCKFFSKKNANISFAGPNRANHEKKADYPPSTGRQNQRLAELRFERYNWYGIQRRRFFCRNKPKMAKKNQTEVQPLETVEPIGKRVLIRKDEDKKETKGGIRLPDNIEIPTITGRVVAISAEIQNSPDIPLLQYDKVLFNPKGAIPVDFEGDNRLFVVEIEHVVAVFRKS
jgi:chaperonin GroES